jgi:hypothetical protein
LSRHAYHLTCPWTLRVLLLVRRRSRKGNARILSAHQRTMKPWRVNPIWGFSPTSPNRTRFELHRWARRLIDTFSPHHGTAEERPPEAASIRTSPDRARDARHTVPHPLACPLATSPPIPHPTSHPRESFATPRPPGTLCHVRPRTESTVLSNWRGRGPMPLLLFPVPKPTRRERDV